MIFGANSQLNWEVGWQDLKDLFRQAGDIIRADIHYGTDGNPKGTGMVVFANAADAVNAICRFTIKSARFEADSCLAAMFDGAELNGMKLEVKEERFSAPQSGPFGGGRGGFAPRGAFAPRGRGGYGGSTIGQTASPSNQIFVKNVSRLERFPFGMIVYRASFTAALVHFKRRLGRAVPDYWYSRICRSSLRRRTLQRLWYCSVQQQ